MAEIQDLIIIGPDNPGADDLFDGSTKIKANFDLLKATSASFSSALPFTRFWTDFATANLSSTTTFSLPATVLPGSKVQMHLTGPGPIRWPNTNLVSQTGTYRNGYLNIVTATVLSGSTSGTARISVTIENAPLATIGLVFRQDVRTNAGLLASESELFSVNSGSGSPGTESKYSILDSIEPERDGYYYFQLRYFNGGTTTGTAIFRQRSNLIRVPESFEVVDDYLAYSGTSGLTIPSLGTVFGGLCRRSQSFGAYCHGHPGEENALSLFRGTLGINEGVLSGPTDLADPFGSVPNFNPQEVVPGYNSDDNIVELSTLELQQ